MKRAALLRGSQIGLVALCALCACQRERVTSASSEGPTPDRLAPGELLGESETAFGLPLPPGMELVREFKDAAYFVGDVQLQLALEHVARYVTPSRAELVPDGAEFSRVYVTGDASKRPLRVSLTRTPTGSQIHVQAIAPPPELTGLSREEIWRRAGRNPDGTPIDPNQLE